MKSVPIENARLDTELPRTGGSASAVALTRPVQTPHLLDGEIRTISIKPGQDAEVSDEPRNQTGNQTGKQTGRQTGRQTSKQTGKQTLLAAIDAQEPIGVTDLAADWPALARWTPEWLSANFGENAVRVYDASFGEPGKTYMGYVGSMSFAVYLDETLVQGKDLRMFLYNIGSHIPELLDDVIYPDVGLKFSRNFVFTFFGCKNAVTPLHFDIDMGYVFYTAVHGRRRIRLFSPDQATALYHHPFTVRSYANLDDPDLAQQPRLSDVRGYEIVLEPGQTLCMPPGYWHEFCYLDAGFGISLRASSSRLNDKLRGLANLLALSPIDRLGNKLGGERWFQWKEQQASKRAAATSQAGR